MGTLLGLLITTVAGWSVQRDNAARAQAEEALREGEGRFRTLANNIPQLAWMADEKGYIFWYNDRWFDYTGTTLEEVAGWGWQKVHDPNHVKRVVEKISRSFKTGEIWDDTFPLRGRDGNYRLFLSRAVPIRDASGKILRWFGTNTDISESKDSGAKYRGLLEAAPDAMVVVNQGGEIVLLNVQAEKQFGYRRDELVGQKVKNIIPEGFAERLIADGTRTAAEALAQQIGTGIELIGTAEGRQRISDRDHAEPAGKRRRNAGDGGDPRHQRAQSSGKASGADGRPIPRAAGSGAGRHGGGESRRGDRSAECAGGETVRIQPR